MKKSVLTSVVNFVALVALLFFCSSFVIASKTSVSQASESQQMATEAFQNLSKHGNFLAKTALLFGTMGAFRWMRRRHRRHYDAGGGGCCGVIVGLGLIVAAVIFLPLILAVAVVVGLLVVVGLIFGIGRGSGRRRRMRI